MTASRTPTSRARRTADSRARILDAAVECLVEGGYAGATTLAVQGRAGVSRGRLLHHFPSREILLAAAAQHLAARRVHDALDRASDELSGCVDEAARIDRVVELMWSTHHEPHYWAAVEMWTAARTNGGIAAAVLPEERRLGAVVRTVVDGMFGAELAARPGYPALRELLLTSMRGVALAYGFDPRDPAGDPHLAQWKAAARAMLAP